jgi:hypothetical protein
MDDEQRKVARDAYVSWNGSRYSVPRRYTDKKVWVRDHDHGPSVEIRYRAERIAVDAASPRRHQVVTLRHRRTPGRTVRGAKKEPSYADFYSK